VTDTCADDDPARDATHESGQLRDDESRRREGGDETRRREGEDDGGDVPTPVKTEETRWAADGGTRDGRAATGKKMDLGGD